MGILDKLFGKKKKARQIKTNEIIKKDNKGPIKAQRAVEQLIDDLKYGGEIDRLNAAMALGKVGDASAVEPLIQALDDVTLPGTIRLAAVISLGEIGDVSAVKSLIQALDDADEGVRVIGAISLGKIGDKRAVNPLTQVLKDENSDLRKAAKEALEKIKKT
jgi:HEAT repeat protein